MIQLRWTDETRWKNYEPRDYSKPVACQLARIRQSWRNCKRKYKITTHDMELRVRT